MKEDNLSPALFCVPAISSRAILPLQFQNGYILNPKTEKIPESNLMDALKTTSSDFALCPNISLRVIEESKSNSDLKNSSYGYTPIVSINKPFLSVHLSLGYFIDLIQCFIHQFPLFLLLIHCWETTVDLKLSCYNISQRENAKCYCFVALISQPNTQSISISGSAIILAEKGNRFDKLNETVESRNSHR